jgi:Variant SH3 domain
MAEYVYARHDFVPEHEDEIAFRAGERIEVIERDDLYSDGWWQVCSLSFVRRSLSVRVQYPFPLVSPFTLARSSSCFS